MTENMIANAKNIPAFEELAKEDTLKVIWVVTILINLSFIFISGVNIFVQVFYLFTVFFVGLLLIALNQTKNTFVRLVLGVLILDTWFIQNVSYRSMGELPFVAVGLGSMAEGCLGIAVHITGGLVWFIPEVVLGLVPFNLVHNLPPNTLAIYVLFYVVNWYVKEAYFLLKKKEDQEGLIQRVGGLIPLFNLPFVPMCIYYLLLTSWEGYKLYREGEEKVVVEKVPEVPEVEYIPPTPKVEPSPQPKPKPNTIPRFRPAPLAPVVRPKTPDPPKVEVQIGGGGGLRENLKKLYSNV